MGSNQSRLVSNMVSSGKASNITRRSVLRGGAMSFLAAAATSAMVLPGVKVARASSMLGNNSKNCPKTHAQISNRLGRLVSDNNVTAETRNIALRSTHCPDCGQHIAPVDSWLARSTGEDIQVQAV